jgi:rhodanese-related sulfurtransferase
MQFMGSDNMFLATTTVWTWLIPIGLGLLIGALIAARKQHDYTKIIVLKAEEFRQNMRKGQLIDLRGESDFAAKRINGSRDFPKMTVFQNLFKLRKDQPVFLYDATDSLLLKRVARKMIRKGLRPIYLLSGGLEKWPFSFKE